MTCLLVILWPCESTEGNKRLVFGGLVIVLGIIFFMFTLSPLFVPFNIPTRELVLFLGLFWLAPQWCSVIGHIHSELTLGSAVFSLLGPVPCTSFHAPVMHLFLSRDFCQIASLLFQLFLMCFNGEFTFQWNVSFHFWKESLFFVKRSLQSRMIRSKPAEVLQGP